MRRVSLLLMLVVLVSCSLIGASHSSRLKLPGSVSLMGGFNDFGLRVGILPFLEAGWFIDEGPYFSIGYDSTIHLASRVSFSSFEEARVTAENVYDYNLVYQEVRGLYEYSAPNTSFLGANLKSEFFFDNNQSVISADLGRFQKVAGDSEKTSYTSIGFSARRRFDIKREFYLINLDSIEVLGRLKWEIEDDLSKFNPFPAYSFVGIQISMSILN